MHEFQLVLHISEIPILRDMAENETTINNLPMDVLRQIMLRLAVAPNGEFYILRSFFM